MPRLIDFSQVKDTFEAVPRGEYDATLTGVRYVEKTATSKGDYLKLEFTLEDDGEFSGRKQWKNCRLLPEALWVYKKYMIALGSDAELFDTAFDVEEEAREHIGDACVLVVGQEPDQRNKDVMRNVIDDIRAAGI
jgi:hypothetical protein